MRNRGRARNARTRGDAHRTSLGHCPTLRRVRAPVVVVPCFDEEDRLDRSAILRIASGAGLRLVLVDDGSTDGTLAVLRELEAASDAIEVLALDRNRGKAEAVRHGLLHAVGAGAGVVAYYDADLSTPPQELVRLLELLESRPGTDVVLASRVKLLGRSIERHAHRHYLGRVFATFASLTLSLPVYDTQCGAKALRVTPALRAALAEPFRSRWAFDVELLGRLLYPRGPTPATARDAVVEMPLRTWHDVGGSKLGPRAMIRAAFDLALVARDLRRRPSFAVATGCT